MSYNTNELPNFLDMETSYENDLILQKVKNGDPIALEKIYRNYYRQVLGFIRRYLEEKDIEDIAQEVFYKVFIKVEKFETIKDFERYLFRSVKNRCLSWLQKEQNYKKLLNVMWYANQTWEQVSHRTEFSKVDLFKKILNEISSDSQRYIDYFYVRKYSRKEISNKLSESESTVFRKLAIAKSEIMDAAKRLKLNIVFNGRHDLEVQEKIE